MEEIKLSGDVFGQIKDFKYYDLTEEQELLIDKLISNKELKERYKKYGLCYDCKEPNSGCSDDYDDYDDWCQSCNAKRFQQDFKYWTSGNHDIDELIQNTQLSAKNHGEVLEWIEYDEFENVEYLAKGDFGNVYKALWKNGYIISWDSENNRWGSSGSQEVALRCLFNSQYITMEFLREAKLHLTTNNSVHCYGITKDTETNNFMIVTECIFNKYYYIKHGICEECKKPNTGNFWCQSCNAKRFQQDFKYWTSGNHDIDELIQNTQLSAKNHGEVLEWIEYDEFENVEYLAKGDFGNVYKAIWENGYIISWDSENNHWEVNGSQKVALKCLYNSQDITVEFLREIKSHPIINNSVRCYGITKDPVTNNFMIVMDFYAFNKYYIKHGICEECKQPNTGNFWCQPCSAQHFQQNFKNWTSGNHNINEFIKNSQLKAKNYWNVFEWIEYDRFENVEHLANGFETVYKAIWKDGYIFSWNSRNNQWERYKEYVKKGQAVALKYLHNTQNITVKNIESHLLINNMSGVVFHCHGITKHPETNDFMIVLNMEKKFSDDVIKQIKNFNFCKLTKEENLLISKLILDEELKDRYIGHGLCEYCKQPNISFLWCQSCNAKHFQQNFKNWTSGNHNIDELIQNAQLKAKNYREVLEWIEYNQFENVEYLAKGGFGTVYKAIWKDGNISGWDSESNKLKRNNIQKVALKCFYNSQDITAEFSREIKSHIIMNSYDCIANCYGITKDPKTNDFMMVMEYASFGSLRQNLDDNFTLFDWNVKFGILKQIAIGLNAIHKNKLIHHDFHCGNILSPNMFLSFITDLGLCQPANVIPSQDGDKKIYGVLPYVAPEVLRGKEYTQASDIYGFGIIAYEVCTGLPPYHDMAHEEFLAIKICNGLRPIISNYKIPQLILNIIKQCWDADPLKRPNSEELVEELVNKLDVSNINSLINKQFDDTDRINKQSTSIGGSLSYTTHTQAVYTSRLLDFKNLPKPKNVDDIDNSIEPEYSDSMAIDFTQYQI